MYCYYYKDEIRLGLMNLEELLNTCEQNFIKAMDLLDKGDVRDAAEKAWGSIEAMRKALLVAVKIPYEIAKNVSTGLPLFTKILRALGRKDLLEKYFFFNSHVHIYGFYEMVTPEDELKKVIEDEVREWITQMRNIIESIKEIDLSSVVDIVLKTKKIKSEIIQKSREYEDLQTQLNSKIQALIKKKIN